MKMNNINFSYNMDATTETAFVHVGDYMVSAVGIIYDSDWNIVELAVETHTPQLTLYTNEFYGDSNYLVA
jgi:hypothetical protein